MISLKAVGFALIIAGTVLEVVEVRPEGEASVRWSLGSEGEA